MLDVARLLTSTCSSIWSCGARSGVLRAVALEMTMSTPPCSRDTTSANAATARRSRTSSTRPTTRALLPPRAATAASTRSWSRLVSRTISAGSRRSARPATKARPNPWVAPVTNAILDVIPTTVGAALHAKSERQARLICLSLMDLSLPALRVLREVADRGSFTAAAAATGYTQSAVSRQIATLEKAVGRRIVDRRRTGVGLTDAGRVLLRHATAALDELDTATRMLAGRPAGRDRVRLGALAGAGAVLVPRVAALVRTRSQVDLVTRAGSTATLLRALRAGTLDLAVVAMAPPFRPLDELSPEFAITRLTADELLVAVPEGHPLAVGDAIDIADLSGQVWISSRSGDGETALGVWPGLAGRPNVVHSPPDWLAKLQLVACGAGITTISPLMLPVLPPGVLARRVRGGSQEHRRAVVARLPRTTGAGVDTVEWALKCIATELSGGPGEGPQRRRGRPAPETN